MIRRILGFIFALTLIIGGAFMFIVMVFLVWVPVKLVVILASVVVVMAGVHWLRTDYLDQDPRRDY
jgi:hypothetical protein